MPEPSRSAYSQPHPVTRAAPAWHRRYLMILGGVYGVLWIALAIDPLDRADWALENVLVLVLAATLGASQRHFVFSGASYTLIFVFLCLHAIGAHYTYAEVPYDRAWRALTGSSFNELLGWERNNYDRLVHFCYGLLLAYPLRELYLRVADVRGFWGYFLPLDFTLFASAFFELVEWGIASMVSDGLAAAYLGTQGDVWDAHKDMALAASGALLAMLVTASINARHQRDFAREWAESLKVKQPLPPAVAREARKPAPRRRRRARS